MRGYRHDQRGRRPCQVLFTASFASEEDALFTSLSEECKEERVYDVGVLTTVGRKAERGQGHQIQSGAKRQGDTADGRDNHDNTRGR